jgi:hypothetical protein
MKGDESGEKNKGIYKSLEGGSVKLTKLNEKVKSF